ncbi:MAG: carboxypeptidase-like regulatory domain-containing protein [Actinomycetota bacterium]|nr:carboxypeptidase-like regulatory domain-containing protein [Actinomycetota bacterium]
MPHFRFSRRLLSFALASGLALAVASVGSTAGSAPGTPAPLGPAEGAVSEALPAFAWQAVAGADRYEFEVAADPGFNSPLFGTGTADSGSFFTKNTRAALTKTVPNGTYWWHVRAVDANGAVSPWSEPRSFSKQWTATPSPVFPADGATVTYPVDPLRLTWTPVDRAAKYLVWVGTDPALGTLVWEPVETQATSFTGHRTGALAPGTYYWAVTPLDAAGNRGVRSRVSSFTWSWPTTTTPTFTDLAPSREQVDPYLAWNHVPGAAGYEVEVNSSSDWAPGSKVCCDPLRIGSEITTLGTSHAPPEQLDNNRFYWRVRAIDANGNAGVWNVGPSFDKTFANVPPTIPPSVKNLRLRDNLGDPYNGVDPDSVGYPVATGVPVLSWNPVPGASSYQVDVTPFQSGVCNWSAPLGSHWVKYTATNAWTPLGWDWNNVKPFPHPEPVSHDFLTRLVEGWQYCARVRPVDRASTASGPLVFGDWTYLPANNTAAFEWTGPAPSAPCTAPCSLAASHYRLPLTGTTLGRMPLFTWQAIPGAESYYVLVSKDASFTNLVDYAYTRIPAYAPRTGRQTKGYPDELTLYYWAVLPADDPNGNAVSATPLTSFPRSFQKRSIPPTLVTPAAGAVLAGPTTFRWTPAEGARRYRLEVSQDPSFANLVDDTFVLTDSTAYTSNTTYPADTVLYWRVRADAEDGASYVGLTWSTTGRFTKRLPTPVPNAEPSAGNFVPTWTWDPVPRAVSYDVHLQYPDGTAQDFTDLRSAAVTPTLMAGPGVWQWQVRANFPRANGSVVHGPYSRLVSFTRTMREPSGPATAAGPSHVLTTWNPAPEAKEYRIQVAADPAFASLVESAKTENTNFAPRLTAPRYQNGGTFYWRVAKVDERNNVGDFTAAQTFALAARSPDAETTTERLVLRARGRIVLRRRVRLVATVRTAAGQPVQGARVRVSGAGIRVRPKLTTAAGRAVFRVRATRRGRVTVTAAKAGYTRATVRLRVRAR